MATIKSFTDLQQSKKLAEILPLESADMHYNDWYCSFYGCTHTGIYNARLGTPETIRGELDIPCWSLASLLNVLPNNKYITTTLSKGGWKVEPIEYIDKWFCEYEDGNSPSKNFSVLADNPVYACVDMIIKLHELKML